jgi:hypothetical protein
MKRAALASLWMALGLAACHHRATARGHGHPTARQTRNDIVVTVRNEATTGSARDARL